MEDTAMRSRAWKRNQRPVTKDEVKAKIESMNEMPLMERQEKYIDFQVAGDDYDWDRVSMWLDVYSGLLGSSAKYEASWWHESDDHGVFTLPYGLVFDGTTLIDTSWTRSAWDIPPFEEFEVAFNRATDNTDFRISGISNRAAENLNLEIYDDNYTASELYSLILEIQQLFDTYDIEELDVMSQDADLENDIEPPDEGYADQIEEIMDLPGTILGVLGYEMI